MKNKITNIESLSKFRKIYKTKKIEKKKNKIKKIILNFISSLGTNTSIASYGASPTCTVISQELGYADKLSFIVDDNPLKQGFYSPGKHIPIYDASKIYSENPDYLLILAWNFADSIMEKHQKYVSMGGSFILPMPSPMIVKN